jgi:predicted ABC-type ATPase
LYFAFENILATKTYTKFIQEAQSKGYFVTMVYFWLYSPELAVERVKTRVISGVKN